MTSIRQRRRNRHKVKAARSQIFPGFTFTLNIDISKVNKALAQAKNAIAQLNITIAPEFQKKAAELVKLAFFPPNFIRDTISLERTRIAAQEEIDYLGDINCKFNARSPHLQCAVNPKGDCVNCQHFKQG